MTANKAHSIHDRLLNRARERGEDYNFLLNRYAVERFLYRLSQSPYQGHFVLKGATLFAVWSDQPYRSTLDVDLAGFGDSDPGALTAIFREIADGAVEDDGLIFRADEIRITSIMDNSEYGGVRVQLPVRLGSANAGFQIDIGFGNAITPAAEIIAYPVLLSGFPIPLIRAYSQYTSVAEKWEAMVSLGIGNSRMKDFSDVWTLSQEHVFDGDTLAAAIAATFNHRGTALPIGPPIALTPEFSGERGKGRDWQSFLRRGNVSGITLSLDQITVALERFLMPPTLALIAGTPFLLSWPPSGPWQ